MRPARRRICRKPRWFPIADGTEELEALTISDVLRRAGAVVTVASVNGLQMTCSRNARLVADRLIGACKGMMFDLIALPGGMLGSERLRDCAVLAEMLKQQASAGRVYAAICAAPVVTLKHHWSLDGKRATCHSSVAAQPRDACRPPITDNR
ncbi:MAG: DJ-1/PfpI family protein [Verrucomicrobiota bacterium]|nr:DJ-1/PfpI family protein [Verrucomicrobiota bacterium]